MNVRLWEYAENLVALQRQAEDLERMLREGVQRWAGKPTMTALASTLQAMVADSTAAAELRDIGTGDKQWLEAKRQWAVDKQREHGCSGDVMSRDRASDA